jgi:hypothetical protein
MAYINEIYEWEGDTTQAKGDVTWHTRDELEDGRVVFTVARIYFDDSDFEAYQALLDLRADIIARNIDKISTGAVDGGGEGYEWDGFPFGGDYLEEVPASPVYSGDKSLTLKTYADGTLKSTSTIYNQKPFKITSGYRGKRWSWRIDGNVDILRQLDVASTARELLENGDSG